MKIETQPLEDHQVRIIAEFEPEVLEKYKLLAARKISETARIPGFRPGKAPLAVIRRMYGEEAIEHEAIDIMMDDEYMEVIKQAGVTPAAPGKLDKIVSTNPPKFEFVVPLAPEVKLGDYHAIRQPYQVADITEDRVDQVIKNMRASYSTAEPVERPVQEGDLVSVKVTGVFAAPAEGEDAAAFPESTPQLIVGENEFEVDDWPFVGFTRELVGMAVDEEKEINHTFAADDPEEKLRGKDVKITAKVTSIKSLTLPEMNDEFAQTLGEYHTVEELRSSIRKTLEDSEKREYDNKYMTAIVDQIRAMSTIAYPPELLEDEIHRVMHSLEDDLAEQKMDLTTYLKTLNKDQDAFIESDAKPVARQRLERSLILDEVAHTEKIELDMEALQSETSATMAALQSDPEFKKMARGRKAEELARGVTMEAANRVLNRQVMARLKAIATGEFEAAAAAVPPVEAEPVLAVEPAAAVPVEAEPVLVVEPTAKTPAVETVAAEIIETPSEPKEKKPRKKKTEAKAD